MVKARIWREAPGDWRCQVPGFRGTAFAPTWRIAYKLGRSLMELPPHVLTPAADATGHTIEAVT